MSHPQNVAREPGLKLGSHSFGRPYCPFLGQASLGLLLDDTKHPVSVPYLCHAGSRGPQMRHAFSLLLVFCLHLEHRSSCIHRTSSPLRVQLKHLLPQMPEDRSTHP